MRSDRLTTDDDVRERVRRGTTRPVTVDRVPDGPALVRGACAVEDDDGTLHAVSRPVVAVCTCGLSQRTPWCDATHKVARSS